MQTLPQTSQYPVVILGQGITGLSCGYHLRLLGCEDFLIIAPEEPLPCSDLSPGMVTGGLWGNFSRLEHAYGKESAREIWQFGHHSFDHLAKYCRLHNLEWHQGRRTRLISSPAELKEAEKAVSSLGKAGFSSRLLPPGLALQMEFPADTKILMVQDDGERGALCGPTEILGSLRKNLASSLLQDQAVSLTAEADQSFTVRLGSNAAIRAEIVVLACHLGAATLWPPMANALVPVADQWAEIRTAGPSGKEAPWLCPGQVTSKNHAYNWLSASGNERYFLGGARYLRKFAGIGDSAPAFLEGITTHLRKEFSECFPAITQATVIRNLAFSEIFPCDELPLIGPLPGEERLLIGSGFMNQGLGMGFFAGKCLADLIYTGEASGLPRQLWPTRLRSL